MSVFKAFFSLGKIPKVIRYYEFGSFDNVNKMGGFLQALKNEARITGRKFSPAQEKYIEDQFRQVKLVFEQIEKYGKQEQGIKKATSAKVFDLKGKEIDPDMPIMGGTQKKELSEAAIKTKLEASNKKSADRIRIDKIKKEISDLEIQINEAEEARSFWSVDEYKKNEEKLSDLITKRNDKEIELELYEIPEDMAQGGRAGFKTGKKPLSESSQVLDPDFDEDIDMEGIIKLLEQMTQERWRDKHQTGGRVPFAMGRRAFLQLLGGVGAGIGALKTGALKMFGKEGATVAKELTQVPIKQTADMPSWFKPLVNKVIKEGTEIPSGAERVIVHKTKLPNSKTDVYVNQDLNNGDVWVDLGMEKHGFAAGKFGQPVRLKYKASEEIPVKGKKGSIKTKEEFNVEEAEFTGGHPENVKFEETSVNKFGQHESNFDEVEMFATGKKKKTRDISSLQKQDEDLADHFSNYPEPDDFASGGIARMLGE